VTCEECGNEFAGSICPRCNAEAPGTVAVHLTTVCNECGEPQFLSPGGETCRLGHGGAMGITPAEWQAKLRAASRGAMREEAPKVPPVQVDADLFPRLAKELEKPNPFAPLTASKDLGEEVSATWGEEVFSPVQYNSFRVGPFSSTTHVRAGETRVDALARLNRDLAAVADAEFTRKKKAFAASLTAVRPHAAS